MSKNMESNKKIMWTSQNYIILKDTSLRLIKNLQVKANITPLSSLCIFFLSDVYMWVEPTGTMCVRISTILPLKTWPVIMVSFQTCT